MLLYERTNKPEKDKYILNGKWNILYITTLYGIE